MADRVRIVVADDHPIYREGVVRAIKSRPEFEIVADAATGREALDQIRDTSPDVALLDVNMPDLNGPAVLNAITRDAIPTRVILLSASLEPDLVYQAVANGVHAYLSKESSREQICDTIAAVGRGDIVLPPEIQAGLAQQIMLRSREERPALTPREREILNLTAAGNSAPEIGRQLHLSPATVKTHMQNLYEKLGVKDRAAAVAEAMRRGLLE